VRDPSQEKTLEASVAQTCFSRSADFCCRLGTKRGRSKRVCASAARFLFIIQNSSDQFTVHSLQ
jgi:hypothetical protein